jgi:exodeoxyribonuclease VII small subunit
VSDEPTFEQAHAELDEIVRRLEAGEVPLDEALELWRRGEELYRLCRERLTAAEARIDELESRDGAEPSSQVDARPGTL